jgi:endogenous inhibitor of DNA gyrase (YacG/DUF329 family)
MTSSSKTLPCPLCGAPHIHEFRPFCSKACKTLDLHRWLRGAYVIEGKDGEASQFINSEEKDPPLTH